MLAYRVREHNKTGQTVKKKNSVPGTRTQQNRPDREKKKVYTTNEVVAFKNRSTRNNVLSVFFVGAPKSRSVYIGPRSTIHLSGPHNKYPTLIPRIFVLTNETWMYF